MNNVIDSELTENNVLNLQVILKWLLVGILGCIVFQSFEYLMQQIIVDILNLSGIAGGMTGRIISEIVGLILIITIFSIAIKTLKKQYAERKLIPQQLIRQFITLYLIIFFLQIVYPLISNFFNISNANSGLDFIVNSHLFISFFYAVETLIKYGFVTWILLKKA